MRVNVASKVASASEPNPQQARLLGGHVDVVEITNQFLVSVKVESCVLIKGEEIVQLLPAGQVRPLRPIENSFLFRFGRAFDGYFATLDLVAFEFDQQLLEKSRAQTRALQAGRDKKIFHAPARRLSI
jgi:hypothetical protein